MTWNDAFQPMIDPANAVNVANTAQMPGMGISLSGLAGPAAFDGRLDTFSIIAAGAWCTVDLGRAYRIELFRLYLGPGDTLAAGNIAYSVDGLQWTEATYTTTGALVTGTDTALWGPVYLIEATPAADPTTLRYVRFRTVAGCERIHDFVVLADYSATIASEIYFSDAEDGEPLTESDLAGSIYPMGDGEQGAAGAVKTVWFVNATAGDIVDCRLVWVNTTQVWDADGVQDAGVGYYGLEVATAEPQVWADYLDGGVDLGTVAAGASIPLYLRWNLPASTPLGEMIARIRVVGNVED